MKKVALYLSGIGTGGIESVTISQFLYMDKSNIEVEFLVDSSPSHNFNVEKIKQGNGIIRTCSDNIKSSRFGKFLRPFTFIKAVRNNQYDVVHFRFSHPASLIYAFLCKTFCNTKVVVTSESQGAVHLPLHYRILCYLCSKFFPIFCDIRLADSNPAGRWMFGKSSFIVMADGFDTLSKKYSQRDRDTLREELKILPNEILIGHIGRFVPEKNHSFIVDVFEDYMKVHPNSKLLLFGKGNLRENIISKCKEKGLYNKCIFIESVDNLDHYYSAMDVFLFPSICEGFSMVAAEAQAASLPVLASSAVPLETKQTDIFLFEELSAPKSKWVEDIDNLLRMGECRDDIDLSKLYQNCDIRNISCELQHIYNKL